MFPIGVKYVCVCVLVCEKERERAIVCCQMRERGLMGENESIIRCFRMASKVYIVMVPKGEFLVTTDQTIFFFLYSTRRKKRGRGGGGIWWNTYVCREGVLLFASKRSHLISVLGDLTWPTESRKSQMGT